MTVLVPVLDPQPIPRHEKRLGLWLVVALSGRVRKTGRTCHVPVLVDENHLAAACKTIIGRSSINALTTIAIRLRASAPRTHKALNSRAAVRVRRKHDAGHQRVWIQSRCC